MRFKAFKLSRCIIIYDGTFYVIKTKSAASHDAATLKPHRKKYYDLYDAKVLLFYDICKFYAQNFEI